MEEGIKMLPVYMLFERSISNLSEHVDAFVYLRLEFERFLSADKNLVSLGAGNIYKTEITGQ